MNMPDDETDWRLRGQESYMQGMVFTYSCFMQGAGGSGHAHCEFCWHKFMENPDGIDDCSGSGYRSRDGRYWVCEECFADFRDAFGWKLED